MRTFGLAVQLSMLIFSVPRLHATDMPPCDGRLERVEAPTWSTDPDEVTRIRQSWSGSRFSDPRKHDRRRFTYVVRMAHLPPTPQGLSEFREFVETGTEGCASLVSDQFPNAFMFRPWGLVLRIPAENILASTPYDMASNGKSARDLRQIGLHTPEALLFESVCVLRGIPRPRGGGTARHPAAVHVDWNEIAYGAARERPIVVEAVVIVPKMMAKRAHRIERTAFVRLAREMDLPVIKIDGVSPSRRSNPTAGQRWLRRLQRL